MAAKSKLSRSILEMKFMKRTKEQVLKEEDAEESRMFYSSEITDKMQHGINFISDPSYVTCEDLIVGRFSCGGMNPEIERILEREEAEEAEKQEQKTRNKNAEMIKDVSDESMVRHYSSLVKTMGKRFDKSKKRKHEDDKDNEPEENRNKIKKN